MMTQLKYKIQDSQCFIFQMSFHFNLNLLKSFCIAIFDLNEIMNFTFLLRYNAKSATYVLELF